MTDDRTKRLIALLVSTAVRPSFRRSCGDANEFFDSFYARLAGTMPGIGAMFHGVDMPKQNALVRDGIERLLDFAERSSPADRTELERLGRLHAREALDVDPALYPGWVDTLVATVREFDPEFTNALETAWREVIAGGINLMAAHYDEPAGAAGHSL